MKKVRWRLTVERIEIEEDEAGNAQPQENGRHLSFRVFDDKLLQEAAIGPALFFADEARSVFEAITRDVTGV